MKGYKYGELGLQDRSHARFDDVRSVAAAVDVVERLGIDKWIGGAMNGALMGDVTPYREVVRRGIAELAAFHEHEGVS